jgi:aminomethyltransferase
MYGSIIEESKAVRTEAGLFDVSHMGRVEISGPSAVRLLDSVLSVDIAQMRRGRARYNVVCDINGGIIDDCIVYRLEDERFLLVPNASNKAAVIRHLERWASGQEAATITDRTADTAMIACQGPDARRMVQQLTDRDLSGLRPFRAVSTTINGANSLLARTGYTGEDGLEIMMGGACAVDIWNSLMGMGARPCGLGARDVLRLEAGLLLHGNDMDTSVNPYEAGLDRFVEPDRPGYVAGASLRTIRDAGPSRRIVGFTMIGRGIARSGYPILDDDTPVGQVTSGGPSPTLDTNIGMGYVPTVYAEPGTRIDIEIRGRPVEAQITTLPFYRRRMPT